MSGRGNLRVRAEDTGWEGMGGYMEAKIRKLEQQFEEDVGARGQSSAIFRGVAIHVNGWTDPTADQLKFIMSKNGGKYHMYYSRTKTTHVIASNLPHAKRKELRPGQNVVKPQWITDSLEAKELLPIEKYLLVPIEEAAQNRITSLLGKRKSIDQDGTPALSSHQSLIPEKSDEQDNNEMEATTSKTANLSRTICPTTDSNFLSEFYSHSRLHFLSTWKMELKEYVSSLQSEESLKEIPLSGFEKLLEIAKSEGTQSQDRSCAVMHIDMDCFFVSVGLRSRPELRGLPVAVTHSTGNGQTSNRPDADPEFEADYYRKKYGGQSSSTSSTSKLSSSMFGPGFSASEIASCSYEARAVGVKNGMFMGKAKQLCPELRVIPYDFEEYRSTSDQLYATLASFTRHIEAVSCDEALVDISKLANETGLSPLRIAKCIRHAVKEVTGCNASTGVGPNIALARMATRHAKPDGEFAVSQEEAKEFMTSLPVKDLPGVGRSTASKLQDMGLITCGDIQNHSVTLLKKEFGAKTGQKLHDMSCGIDKREVEVEKERKSVSAEVNYGIRLSNDDEAKTFFKNLAKEVTNRLKSVSMRGRRLTLKVMVRRSDAPQESVKYGGHGICDSLSRSMLMTLKNKGDVYEEDCLTIYETAWGILTSLHLNVCDLRGIGIQVTQLQSAESTSSNAESSSAAFLKKFIVKKSDLPALNEKVEKIIPANEPSTSIVVDDFSREQVPDDVTITEPINEAANLSFLDALPPDLRKEVEGTFAQQKEALERNFPNFQNENSNDSTSSSVQILDENSRDSTSSIVFCDQGKLSTLAKQVKKSGPSASKGKSRRGGKSKTAKTSKSRKTRSSNPVSNKLITDMFPVTYSPNKPGSAKNSPAGKQKTSPAKVKKNLSTVEKARKRLMDINKCSEIPGTSELAEIQDPDIPLTTVQDSLPTLGGAFKIDEIRVTLTEWIKAYSETGPLECDVNDFISFLVKTANELRDLEKVYMTLKSLRRKVISLEHSSSWANVYSDVCDRVQSAIKESYRGGELAISPL